MREYSLGSYTRYANAMDMLITMNDSLYYKSLFAQLRDSESDSDEEKMAILTIEYLYDKGEDHDSNNTGNNGI